jgi:ketosteroid isomerase-like protein
MTEDDAVLAADDRRLKAMIAADVDALDRLFADELIVVHGNGVREDKSAHLESYRSGRLRYRTIERSETQIAVTGNVAVVCALLNVEVTIGGENKSSPVRYMGVWIKGADGWRMLAIDNVRPARVGVHSG